MNTDWRQYNQGTGADAGSSTIIMTVQRHPRVVAFSKLPPCLVVRASPYGCTTCSRSDRTNRVTKQDENKTEPLKQKFDAHSVCLNVAFVF